MTLQQLAYFVAAVEHGSFTAAADALRLARPSLSEQIARLEAELGVALFIRAGRRLRLTDAGRLLRPEAERTLAAARDAGDVVRRARALTGGTASFGTFSTAHHFLLGPLIEDFCRRHPEVSVRVVGQNSAEVADAVRQGHLEAGLVALPVDDDQLDVGPPIATVEVVYISADPTRLRRPVTIEDLSRARLVFPEARWGNSDPTRRQLAERAQRAGVSVQPYIEVEYATAALDLTARGLADTITMRTILDTMAPGHGLGSVRLEPPMQDTYAFITRRNARLSPATRAFIALGEQHVAALNA
jgi:DNA-binding transcriptional LysR family regulator